MVPIGAEREKENNLIYNMLKALVLVEKSLLCSIFTLLKLFILSCMSFYNLELKT